ncbi:VOC family protein [Anaerosporobacter sp.]|uniref:VOC family protein n=1 Tax=Anaerosporobacter sp. TaxID=1872529 RepID=UPI00286F2747|nr:VOC family protein [Anaerosporobacter sp.]
MMIHHVALYVKDLEREREFFEIYFNGEAGEKYHNPKKGFTSYFISFKDGAKLEIMNDNSIVTENESSKQRLGYAHIAFSVGSKEAVDELTMRLQTDGFRVISGPRTTGDGYYESCVFDGEGNRIEITV